VYITEKHSVAKDLATYLGIERKETDAKDRRCGYFVVSGGDVVVWQIGHMRQLVDLNHYLPEHLKKGDWRPEQLQVIPEKMITEPTPDSDEKGKKRFTKDGQPLPSPQYKILIDLIRKADIIVNAGDIDKEGQLVADEILEAAGVDPAGGTKPVERILINALDPDSLKKILSSRRSNGEPQFVNLRMAATARRDADWTVGIFGTRAMSCAAQGATVPIGRVMTAVLSIVVDREDLISKFVAKTFYVPVVRLPDGLEMEWKGRSDGQVVAGMDEEGRIVDRRLAEAIVARIQKGLPGIISRVDGVMKKVAQPLPHSIGQLQVEMGAREGMMPEATMRAAQSLYQNHKAITYVGTDCRYLPEAMHGDGRTLVGGLAAGFMKLCQGADCAIKSPAWNDKKVDAHHGIIPTGVLPQNASEDERKVYAAIVKRYLAQFYPAHEYRSNIVEAGFGEDTFSSTWKEVTRPGWQEVDPEPAYLAQCAQGPVVKSAVRNTDDGDDEDVDDAETQQDRAEAKARM
jgi:DNA topoisomerase-3